MKFEFNEREYIENPAMELLLEPYRSHTQENNICILSGPAGSGKSMLVRHVFNFQNTSPIINGNTLVIPISFHDTFCSDTLKLFVQILYAACDTMVAKYPKLHSINSHINEFYDFIVKCRMELLYKTPLVPPLDKEHCLQTLCNADPLVFYALVLKFYLSQNSICPINNVVVVLDDLEEIRLNEEDDPNATEERPIKIMHELFECLQCVSEGIIPWSLNAVICCRSLLGSLKKFSSQSFVENIMNMLESHSSCKLINMDHLPPFSKNFERQYNDFLHD